MRPAYPRVPFGKAGFGSSKPGVRSYNRLLVLAELLEHSAVDVQMRCDQFMRSERHPLRKRDIDEARRLEQFEEAQRFGPRVFDEMAHRHRDIADVAGPVVECP